MKGEREVMLKENAEKWKQLAKEAVDMMMKNIKEFVSAISMRAGTAIAGLLLPKPFFLNEEPSTNSLLLGISDQDCKDVELVGYLLFAAEKVGQADCDSAEKILIRCDELSSKRGWRKKYEEDDDLEEALKSLGPCIAYPQKIVRIWNGETAMAVLKMTMALKRLWPSFLNSRGCSRTATIVGKENGELVGSKSRYCDITQKLKCGIGSEGHLVDEAKFINLSLTSLGKCINAVAKNSPHMPTRDSKLTRLLRDSFGDGAREERSKRNQDRGQSDQGTTPSATVDMVQKRFATEKRSGAYGRGKVLDIVRKPVANVENNETIGGKEKESNGVEVQVLVGDKAAMS
nr:kinesin-like protein KIN-UC isoform X1 [Ipomoea batatas]